MLLLIILAVILAVLAIILTARVRVDAGYGKNGPFVTVRFLFFSYRIVGGKKKKIKKRDFKIGRFRRRKKRVMKKYLESSKEKKPKKKRASSGAEKISVKERIDDLYKSFGGALKAFPKSLKIYCKKLVIAVGGKDAHDMATNYGAVIQGVQYAATTFVSYTGLYRDKNSDVNVYPAFNDGKWSAEVDFDFKIRTASLIKLGFMFLKGYLKYKNISKKRRASSAGVNAEGVAT